MDIFIKNDWYDTYKFDLIAYKINGPRFALRDLPLKCKSRMFMLIKEDYMQIKDSKYYQDFLDNLVIDLKDDDKKDEINQIINKVTITNTIMNSFDAKKNLAQTIIDSIP